MVDIAEVVRKLLAKGKYAVDVEHIEEGKKGKNKPRKILVMDVLFVLFSDQCKHYEGESLDKKLVIFSEGFDANNRHIRVVSRLINTEGEIIISVMHADLADYIFATTAYKLNKETEK